MRTGDGGEEALDGALRELLDAWQATADGWRDAARSEIDQQHIEPLRVQAKQAARSLAELSRLCRDAVRRCS
jgi:hypothetical protein